jgi:Ca-activated chloride channel family protein
MPFLVLLAVSVFAQTNAAPTPTPEETPPPAVDNDDIDSVVRVKTDLVTLTLTVTDVYGRFVSGLKKEAFTIYDNGEQQDITFFSDADAPISIGIVFDVSGSMNSSKIEKARAALEKFVNMSHPSDEYFLIAFSDKANLLMDRTRDADAVLRKLTLIKPQNDTALYDACYLGIERVTRGTHRKKALLIISDGQDNASRYNFGEVRRLMKESDVVTYAEGIVDAHDLASPLGMQGQQFLDELTSVTGGRAFYPSSDVEMEEIFERIALELRHQYSIGYTPKDFQLNGKWRKVRTKIKPPRGLPRLTVRGREGYYATPSSDLQ